MAPKSGAGTLWPAPVVFPRPRGAAFSILSAMDTSKDSRGLGQTMFSRPGLPLAAASKRFRVITKDEIAKRIEEAIQKDRQLRADRLHEEAKSRIIEARSALREAIQQIESMKGRESALLAKIDELHAENEALRGELSRSQEISRMDSVDPAPTNGHASALVEKSAWDSLAARVARIEELLGAHLLQDHRGQSGDEDPPESNGRNKRRRLR